jgi:acetyl-CoA hydrolase
MDAGVCTGAAKPIDTGIAVTGSVLGSAKALARLGGDHKLVMRSIDYTHDPHVIAQLDHFAAINTALEVDLLGQVNAEYAGARYVGAVGGSVDFPRAAPRARHGLSVIALPSTTTSGRTRIVPRVRHATATRSDAGLVVTEFGVADLRGASITERISRLVDIAAPEHRAELQEAGRDLV